MLNVTHNRPKRLRLLALACVFLFVWLLVSSNNLQSFTLNDHNLTQHIQDTVNVDTMGVSPQGDIPTTTGNIQGIVRPVPKAPSDSVSVPQQFLAQPASKQAEGKKV
eukprot:TRINITY_DN5941_c0_g1_i1.p1 TRINITY_DN5941_c0_g1~~TRINITY_DN5941_c0_g1_i1.p1  ORF type:complete len:107 (-),score=18.63 TRINITY_DN5941_c0_g1_i1:69-389(-)